MSRQEQAAELRQETQQLLNGPLKNVRAAALAAALVPLASLAAAPASADPLTCSAGLCGVVWYDANGNSVQDDGETGISGIEVKLYSGDELIETTITDEYGFYYFYVEEGTYDIFVRVPPDKQPSAPDAGDNDAIDSDGVLQSGYSVATNVSWTLDPDNPFPVFVNPEVDFGLVDKPVSQPGTGTPGYWKNHPEAWTLAVIDFGNGVTFTQDEALVWLRRVGKDKTTTMFSSLVPAMLNVAAGNDGSCVAEAIAFAKGWLIANPVGSGVGASTAAWAEAEPWHGHLDDYNNGKLCAPARQ